MATDTLHLSSSPAHEADLYVPVAVPHDTDPAAVSSMVLAIEKALAVLAQAKQGDVIARADLLAEIATGLLQPSSELLEDRVQRMRTLLQVFTEGEWLTSEQLNSLQDAPPKNKSQPASDWKRRDRIFSVSRSGREYFACYQFDAMYEPLPVIREVLKAFGDVADPWMLAAWFHYPNAWIAGVDGAPVAPKDALDRRDDVVHAALQRRTSYVA
ncbi:hypothetical protein KM864_18500 (plasmid) [Ralstonia solanacearum]|uniref:hypothetical protein n=1 Tax=Ralstonia pseudosolanacearum TaxID=1310165 RepID=UPI001677FD4B|nr:hypothetical protein [Ralstonia pseudosolanacearum]QWF62991.1 hypothetical protein KM864_18500 [Ralstonia solanacearum]